MSSPSEALRAAKSSPRTTRDVQILLDAGLGERRDALDEKMDRALSIPPDDRFTGVSPQQEAVNAVQDEIDALNLEAADALVTLRFARLPGDQWTEITARCPVRVESAVDRQYNYNMQAVCKLAAPLSGGWLIDGKVVPLTITPASEGVARVDEWADLFENISGFDMGQIMEAIYRLNEYDPASAIETLKKELATRPA